MRCGPGVAQERPRMMMMMMMMMVMMVMLMMMMMMNDVGDGGDHDHTRCHDSRTLPPYWWCMGNITLGFSCLPTPPAVEVTKPILTMSLLVTLEGDSIITVTIRMIIAMMVMMVMVMLIMMTTTA